MKLLYFLLLGSLLLFSCQSEYQKQLVRAKKLVMTEQQIKSSASSEFKRDSRESLQNISEEIRFQAHMSGNEQSFMQEVDKYRKSLEIDEHTQSPLISRFP